MHMMFLLLVMWLKAIFGTSFYLLLLLSLSFGKLSFICRNWYFRLLWNIQLICILHINVTHTHIHAHKLANGLPKRSWVLWYLYKNMKCPFLTHLEPVCDCLHGFFFLRILFVMCDKNGLLKAVTEKRVANDEESNERIANVTRNTK